ncbi:hypothetical protein TraAM80_08291 [Trypanosoma rangeli]|uniref:Uncharacterized protein n=1 Tax=Trypanosoma rangeli TaxID=5698 RepID=A0A422N1F8_TRYRA|nr:uncharacterized protein TraAM80_08291 [Trypanosoma rangeli]RNE99306.1 hypothetical protein TraAM80_08291 [Trypanosoma rangeli]|eukprot:RNE99306.1 hypothetical protein TraAM80_08291 [Trypanosoma rangeli]
MAVCKVHTDCPLPGTLVALQPRRVLIVGVVADPGRPQRSYSAQVCQAGWALRRAKRARAIAESPLQPGSRGRRQALHTADLKTRTELHQCGGSQGIRRMRIGRQMQRHLKINMPFADAEKQKIWKGASPATFEERHALRGARPAVVWPRRSGPCFPRAFPHQGRPPPPSYGMWRTE